MKRILLGTIASAHGIRGEVLVKTFTGDPAAIASYGALTDEAGGQPLTLAIVRVTPRGVIARVTLAAPGNSPTRTSPAAPDNSPTRSSPAAPGNSPTRGAITDRTAAEALKGRKLFVERARLPPPADDEFYHEDLIGLAAVAPNGAALGVVVAVQNYGAGDLLEIRRHGARATELVPFTRAVVPVIDITGQRVTVMMPEVADDQADGAEGDGRGG